MNVTTINLSAKRCPANKAAIFVIGLLTVLMTTLAPTAAAADLALYKATVPVSDQSTESRVQALRAGMALVLVRITGDRAVASSNAGQRLLRRAPQFVQQYRYARRAVPLGEFGPISDEMVLNAEFDANALQAAVRNVDLPLWGSERPSTLIWLLIRDDAGYRFAADNSRERDAVQQVANQRGLTLLLPPATTAIRPAGPRSDDVDAALFAASASYQSNRVVRVFVDALSGAARWRVLTGRGDGESWASSGGSQALALANGSHALADQYAKRFAVTKANAVAGAGETLLLQVSGIRSLSAYAELGRHLESVTVITNAQLSAASADTLRYKLQLDGDAELLKAALSLGRLLQPSAAPLPKPAINVGDQPAPVGIATGDPLISGVALQTTVESVIPEPKAPNSELPVLYYRFGSL